MTSVYNFYVIDAGDEVDWVQCDKCEEWFHLNCLGLNKKDLREDEDFVCSPCNQRTRLASGDHLVTPIMVPKATPSLDNEEIISVVSTPVPSASQSPVNDISRYAQIYALSLPEIIIM